MTCADVREAAAAYALGALEPAEAREVERHLAAPGPHQGCREAVDEARGTAAELAGAVGAAAVRPSPGVWAAIEARTGEGPRRVRAAWCGVAAFAAVAAAVALVMAGLSARERDRARGALAALQGERALEADALALLDRPGVRVVPLEAQAGQAGRAVAIVDAQGGRALIVSSALPPRPGKDYQLWVIRGAAPPVPAGFLRPSGRGAAGEIDPALLRGAPPDALAVSLEPAGGSPAPTQVLLVGKISG